MTPVELTTLLEQVQMQRAESSTLELKAAAKGCPTRLYDTLSSFSNQDEGGIILFGVDEQLGFALTGVYDAQELIKHVAEQCSQMSPDVRPMFTVASLDGKTFVSAEIPGIDAVDRPCFYKGKGRLQGSYIRVGDSDQHMTEYEIYSYEAFRRKYQDDIRPVERASLQMLDQDSLELYLNRRRAGRPNFSRMTSAYACELFGLTKEHVPTLIAVLLFCPYPQVYFPQLCITAVSVPGTEIGQLDPEGARFLDNQRIEGTLSQMLEEALTFVKKNIRTKTIIDPETGKRIDQEDYPLTAVREAILNALIHRDYSIHTESMPIRLLLFEDRFEVHSPGGLYGRLRIDQLGKVQSDIRNPTLVVAMEAMGETENRYSGIPTMRQELMQAGMQPPEFREVRDTFVVCFRKARVLPQNAKSVIEDHPLEKELTLLDFCAVPRSRQEIATFLNVKSVSYAVRKYVMPLVETGLLMMSLPEKPTSPKQRYTARHPE